MYKSICVTNRHLVAGDFIEQLKKVAACGCSAIILREKDLTKDEYERLAGQVLAALAGYEIPCILHTYVDSAIRLQADRIHLPSAALSELSEKKKRCFQTIGVSVHSREEAVCAWKAGADYLTAGHVFATDCKKGVPPRGLDFLSEICAAVPIPVYAIGGITPENAQSCIAAGAAGVCMMSGYMKE